MARYRQLLERGLPQGHRAYRHADRLLFRILSRDDDPSLLFEYQKPARTNIALGIWARDLLREAATATLAQAKRIEDPRVRGSAHRIVTNLARFLRSDLAEKPIVRRGGRNILQPEAVPPTIFSVATVAFMPRLQRERAGFLDRLELYLTKRAPKRTYVIRFGRKIIKPTFQILGEPLHADSAGNPKDLPFALHWIELLLRMGIFERSAVAGRILSRLLRDCDKDGVWHRPNLRTLPKSPSKLADFAFPLELDGRTQERRRTDVTFRLALLAKLAGWDLEFN
ncbi:MAG: hypothetical protein ACE5HT_02110 [Gemmatimonadales bacterium]